MRSYRTGLPAAAAVAATAIMLLKLTGCGGGGRRRRARATPPPVDQPDGGARGGPDGPLTIAPGPSRGSAIAISADDSVVVAVNRDSGSVTVFKTTFPEDGSPATLAKSAEVPVGAEPWQVAISPDGDTAYVVAPQGPEAREGRRASRARRPSPARSRSAPSRPASRSRPGGTRAWVANWVDGTLTGVDTATMNVKSTIDLNAALVGTKLVGDVKAAPRARAPALRRHHEQRRRERGRRVDLRHRVLRAAHRGRGRRRRQRRRREERHRLQGEALRQVRLDDPPRAARRHGLQGQPRRRRRLLSEPAPVDHHPGQVRVRLERLRLAEGPGRRRHHRRRRPTSRTSRPPRTASVSVIDLTTDKEVTRLDGEPPCEVRRGIHEARRRPTTTRAATPRVPVGHRLREGRRRRLRRRERRRLRLPRAVRPLAGERASPRSARRATCSST